MNKVLYKHSPWQAATQNINPNASYHINVPISLAKSIEGKYFLGIAENLDFGNVTNAWARLYNPPGSGVNLFVNTWTVSDILATPFKVLISFNSSPRGFVQNSQSVTPSNLTLVPQPQNQVQLQYAIAVTGFPTDGVRAFTRYGLAGTSINSEEEGKFIFPPGSSFMITISNPERPTMPATGSISFGWWEEPI